MSFTSAIRSGLRPYEYKSVIEASCLEAILDFKIWGKTPCLGCYFRDISTGKKFVLYAHDDCHSHRYTPKDKEFDFSQSGIEGSLFYLVTRKTRTGKTLWQNARLLLGPDQQFGTGYLKYIPALNELPFGVPPFCFRHVFLFESPTGGIPAHQPQTRKAERKAAWSRPRSARRAWP